MVSGLRMTAQTWSVFVLLSVRNATGLGRNYAWTVQKAVWPICFRGWREICENGSTLKAELLKKDRFVRNSSTGCPDFAAPTSSGRFSCCDAADGFCPLPVLRSTVQPMQRVCIPVFSAIRTRQNWRSAERHLRVKTLYILLIGK